MKKLLVFGMCATLLIAFSSCRSSESAYKKAYEKAKLEQKKSEAPVSGATAPVAVEQSRATESTAPANVKQEKVTVVSGDAINDYNVVAGSFGLKANAEGLKDYLTQQGYKAAIAFNSENAMYRVIAASYTDYQSAVQGRDSFKSKYPNRKDFQGAWVLFRVK
jgi:cell division protein FtsN